MLRVLLIGFGFMGRMHADILRGLDGVELTGVVEPRLEDASKALREAGWADIPVFSSLEEGLHGGLCDAVDICLPTDLHRPVAEAAFAAGCHVFCEKPIALTVADGEAMTRAAEMAGRQLMVGHCIRFWPEYEVLREAVGSGTYGRLLSLSMSRRNARPNYAVGGWVNDPARCVGAALDMHIHDTDFLCYLLGLPRAVMSRGVREDAGWNSISSLYDFGPDGPLVFADGAWNYPTGWPFQMQFSAVFESAALQFDSLAHPSLQLASNGVGPSSLTPPGPKSDGYHRELEYFVGQLTAGRPIEMSTGKDATQSLAVTLAEIESAAMGGLPVSLSK